MTHKVIQWSTGNVGRFALQVHHRAPRPRAGRAWWSTARPRTGVDAGTLCGLDPVGVIATTDTDAALALDADVVSYTATGDLRPWEAVDRHVPHPRVAARTSSRPRVVSLCYPPAADAEMVEQLDAACRAGGTSCFTSGIDPGFANDLLPLVLTGACSRVDHVRIQEILNYDTYDQPEVLFEHHGLRQAPRQHAAHPVPGRPDHGVGPDRAHDRRQPRHAARRHRRVARALAGARSATRRPSARSKRARWPGSASRCAA